MEAAQHVGSPALVRALRCKIQAELKKANGHARRRGIVLSSHRAESLAWDIVLVWTGIRCTCLIDVFQPSEDTVPALQSILKSLDGPEDLREASHSRPSPGSQTLCLLKHAPSGQFYIIKKDLVRERCNSLEAPPVAHPTTQQPWFIDARKGQANPGTRLSGPPRSLHELIAELSEELSKQRPLSPSSAPMITLNASAAHSKELTSRVEGIALCGFLLEYPCIYCLDVSGAVNGNETAASDAPADENNLASEPLTLVRVVLRTEGRDSAQVQLPHRPGKVSVPGQSSGNDSPTVPIMSFSVPSRTLVDSSGTMTSTLQMISSDISAHFESRRQEAIARLANKTSSLQAGTYHSVSSHTVKSLDADIHGLKSWLAASSIRVEPQEDVRLDLVGL